MLNAHGDFVYERTLLMLVGAARRLGIDVDISGLAPTRYRSGDDTVVPTSEYQAVLRRIFTDPRETLGIELAGGYADCNLGLVGDFCYARAPHLELCCVARNVICAYFSVSHA